MVCLEHCNVRREGGSEMRQVGVSGRKQEKAFLNGKAGFSSHPRACLARLFV